MDSFYHVRLPQVRFRLNYHVLGHVERPIRHEFEGWPRNRSKSSFARFKKIRHAFESMDSGLIFVFMLAALAIVILIAQRFRGIRQSASDLPQTSILKNMVKAHKGVVIGPRAHFLLPGASFKLSFVPSGYETPREFEITEFEIMTSGPASFSSAFVIRCEKQGAIPLATHRPHRFSDDQWETILSEYGFDGIERDSDFIEVRKETFTLTAQDALNLEKGVKMIIPLIAQQIRAK